MTEPTRVGPRTSVPAADPEPGLIVPTSVVERGTVLGDIEITAELAVVLGEPGQYVIISGTRAELNLWVEHLRWHLLDVPWAGGQAPPAPADGAVLAELPGDARCGP